MNTLTSCSVKISIFLPLFVMIASKTNTRTLAFTKEIFRELPYYNLNFIPFHGQFNNSINSNLPTKKYLERLTSLHDLDLFSLNTDSNSNPDCNLSVRPIRSNYYSPYSFSQLTNSSSFDKFTDGFSIIHNNVRSLKRNLENFQTHLLSELGHHFNVIGITETRINHANFSDFNPEIPNYNFEFIPTPLAAGGVGMYIDDTLKYTVIKKTSNEFFQALWVDIDIRISGQRTNVICGVIYIQHNSPEKFQTYFDETIERLSASGKTIYLMGDFNINLLSSETCKYAQNFLLSLQSVNLLPTIDKPTRVYNNSATLIDNIFVNNLENDCLSGNIVSDLSDHYTQFCILRLSRDTIKPHKSVRRDYSRFSEARFLSDLSGVDWERPVTENNNNIDQSFSALHSKLNETIDKHAPLKPLSMRKAKQLTKPWITKGLIKSIKIKNKLFYSGDKDKYKLYRNKILLLTRLSKKLYYHNYFETNLHNMKKTWEGINNLISRNKKGNKSINTLKRPNNKGLAHKPSEISNILNNHFASIGHKLACNMPNSPVPFTAYLPTTNIPGSFVFDPTSPSEIELVIMQTPLDKAYGLYSCPTRILRCARHIISRPLSVMINNSVSQGVYPSKLKHAKVTPIYKGEDNTDPGNYRPISLLSIFNRIFEKVMYNRLKPFLDKHDVLYKSQYGFREKRSTQHALLDIVSQIQSNMDRGLFSCGIFIDLKKAFDTVDHSILLNKLQHYGIRGIINEWFSSYLTARTQVTQIGHNISDKANTLCGVPQGSVLGPLLFLIYINDIYNSSDKLKFHLFADDTNLLYADKNLKSLETVVNTELTKIHNWLTANKLSLNIKKSNFVIFHQFQKRLNYQVNLKIFDHNTNSYISLECVVPEIIQPPPHGGIGKFRGVGGFNSYIFPRGGGVNTALYFSRGSTQRREEGRNTDLIVRYVVQFLN